MDELKLRGCLPQLTGAFRLSKMKAVRPPGELFNAPIPEDQMHNIFVRQWPVCFGLLLFVLWWHADSQDRDGTPDDITGGGAQRFNGRVRGFPLTHSRQIDDRDGFRNSGPFEVFNQLALVMNYLLGFTAAAGAIGMIRALQFKIDPSDEAQKRFWFWVIPNFVVVATGILWILIKVLTDLSPIIDYF